MRELLVWWEINRTHTMGRYVFVPFDTTLIYEHLLGLAVLVFLVGWLIRRSRLGVALLVIGDDETMARQAGINVPLAKVAMFVVSSVFMTVVGAVMAPRFGYLTPHFAFNPLISFQVVIMALLGGMQRLWGPVLGVVPLIAVGAAGAVSVLVQRFLGLVFMVIVYFFRAASPARWRTVGRRCAGRSRCRAASPGRRSTSGRGCRSRSPFRAASRAYSKMSGRGSFAASRAEAGDGGAARSRRADQGVRRPRRREQHVACGVAGRGSRPGRRQRIGQDHLAQSDRRHHSLRRRQHPHRGEDVTRLPNHLRVRSASTAPSSSGACRRTCRQSSA
jgi:hypothetical protein